MNAWDASLALTMKLANDAVNDDHNDEKFEGEQRPRYDESEITV